MEISAVAACQANRPAIAVYWTGLLQAAPPAPATTRAVMTPGMLEFLIDETLDHLTGRLQQAGRNPPAHHAPLPCGLRFKGCACGLHVLLTFYTTGAQAIHETLPDQLGHARLEIMQCFNALAHGELTRVCDLCHYRNGAGCLPRAPAGGDRERTAGFPLKRLAAQLP